MESSQSVDSPKNLEDRSNNFILNLFKDMITWFFRGLASCASSALGFMIVTFSIVLAFLAISFGLSFGSDSDSAKYGLQEEFRNYGGSDKIALIELDGIIIEKDPGSDPFSTTLDVITPDKVEFALNEVRSDDEIKAAILYISSPGGSPVASDRIFEVITDFKKASNKPITVMMGDVAASGGYYISAPADYIMANPATITGSIGVILETYNLQGLYEKIGVQKVTFKTGEFKDVLNEARDITESEKEMIDTLIQDAYRMFINRVAEGRQLPLSEVEGLADGRVLSGESAKALKLIDNTGTLNGAIGKTAELAGLKEYKVVKVRSTTFWDDLFYGLNLAITKVGLNLNVLNTPSYQILYKLP